MTIGWKTTKSMMLRAGQRVTHYDFGGPTWNMNQPISSRLGQAFLPSALCPLVLKSLAGIAGRPRSAPISGGAGGFSFPPMAPVPNLKSADYYEAGKQETRGPPNI